MKKLTKYIGCFCLFFGSLAFANEEHAGNKEDAKIRAKEALANIIRDNNAFSRKHTEQCFDPFLNKQTPRITLLSCSDSRVQTYALDETPDNDLFVVRNIGNQIRSNEGSVEYGIAHLGTNVLLILGHTGCGAVKAALGEVNKLEPAVRKEVETLGLSQKNLKAIPDEIWFKGVTENVNNQVKFALKKFAKPVAEGRLVVVGAVYDLHNLYGHGNGRMVLINIDGITAVKELARHPLLKDTSVNLAQ